MASRTNGPVDKTRFAWVLWLALVVPLAQLAVNWHAQSHWNADRIGQIDSKHALGGDPCDLCVAAGALTGGGAAGTALVVAHAPQVRAAPQTDSRVASPAPLVLAYESRAPPTFLR
ncbi:MAG: hypothetical protein ABIR26_10065 [Ramlibacter sp.]